MVDDALAWRAEDEAIAGLVAAATDVDVHAGVQRAAVRWTVRKQHTIDTLADAGASTGRVLLAAKLDNVRALLTDLPEHGPEVGTTSPPAATTSCGTTPPCRTARVSSATVALPASFRRAVEQLEQAVYARSAPRTPSDWDATAAAARPCGDRNWIHGARCARPRGHRGLHAYSPRPGDL